MQTHNENLLRKNYKNFIIFCSGTQVVLKEEQIEKIKKALPDYYSRHINRDLHIYTAKKDEEIIACGFLLVIEKPANPSFIHGKVGTVLNVYTKSYNKK